MSYNVMFWFSNQNKEQPYPTPRPFLSLWWAQSLLLAVSGCAMHYCWATIRSGVPESTSGCTLSWRTEDPLTDLPLPSTLSLWTTTPAPSPGDPLYSNVLVWIKSVLVFFFLGLVYFTWHNNILQVHSCLHRWQDFNPFVAVHWWHLGWSHVLTVVKRLL